eukprot:14934716-Ditylum_brightwellii.AAC.1
MLVVVMVMMVVMVMLTSTAKATIEIFANQWDGMSRFEYSFLRNKAYKMGRGSRDSILHLQGVDMYKMGNSTAAEVHWVVEIVDLKEREIALCS